MPQGVEERRTNVELSVQSAQRIVDEISGIVGQHINMMDERGNISLPARTAHGWATSTQGQNAL